LGTLIGENPADTRPLERFCHSVGRGINRFDMIRDGDRILLAVSGGKDSIALSLALVARKRWVPIDYHLEALQIEWKEYPYTEGEKAAVDAFFSRIGVPLKRVSATIHPPTFHKEFSCYQCARNRKRILFDHAAEIGATKVAVGHHMDDIAETTMINLFFRGEFSTMMPVQEFFGGKLHIIRPLCEVREAEVRRICRRLGLPSLPNKCPRADKNQRVLMKEILRMVSHVDKHAVSNIYGAPWRINREYLPTDLDGSSDALRGDQ